MNNSPIVMSRRQSRRLSIIAAGLGILCLVQVATAQDAARSKNPKGPANVEVVVIEGESLRIRKVTRGKARVQSMAGFKGDRWRGNKHLWWTGGRPADQLTLAFTVARAGRYRVQAVFTKARDYGRHYLSINGRGVGTFDLFAEQVSAAPVQSLGVHQLKQGDNTLAIQIAGAHPKAAKGYMFAIDFLTVTPSKAPVSPAVKPKPITGQPGAEQPNTDQGPPAEPLVERFKSTVFSTPFDDKLTGWTRKREDAKAWRVKDGQLQVHIQPGNMWGRSNNARNVFVRPLPKQVDVKQGVAIEITVATDPTKRWEQAGMTWYYDDSHMVKLVRELEHGKVSIVMGREQGDRTKTIALIPIPGDHVRLRLEVQGSRIVGRYRLPGDAKGTWRLAGTTDLPRRGKDDRLPPNISLQCYNGPPSPAKHWATFSDLRILVPKRK